MCSIEDDVRRLVAEISGTKLEGVKLSTDLVRDLGIAGEDGVDLMNALAERFDVDLSDFDADSHFGPEAAFSPVYWLWCRVFCPDRLRLAPITVSDLIAAARSKRWNSPDSN